MTTKDPEYYKILEKSRVPFSIILTGQTKDGFLGLVAMEYPRAGADVALKERLFGKPTTAPAYGDAGVTAEIDTYMKLDPTVGINDDVTWLKKLIGIEISAQPKEGLKEVGPPISILEISKTNGPSWLCQQKCAAIISSRAATKPASPGKKKSTP